MKKLIAISLILLCAPSCKGINKDALAAWNASDISIMQDLSDYRKAAGKPVDDITAHLAKQIGDISGEEEAALMAEILADVAADPKKSDARKASYPVKVTSHLNLFHALKGN